MVTIRNDTLKHYKSQLPSETMYVSVIVLTKRFQAEVLDTLLHLRILYRASPVKLKIKGERRQLYKSVMAESHLPECFFERKS
jgi:hypothetical protein